MSASNFKVIRIPRKEFEFSNAKNRTKQTWSSFLICDVTYPRNSTFDISLDS